MDGSRRRTDAFLGLGLPKWGRRSRKKKAGAGYPGLVRGPLKQSYQETTTKLLPSYQRILHMTLDKGNGRRQRIPPRLKTVSSYLSGSPRDGRR